MKILHVSSSKGQIKIQQMAFVLVAIMIFFVMVGLAYYSFRMEELRKDVSELKGEEAKSLVRKLANSAEFNWPKCANCIDLDKVLILSEREAYDKFWNLDYIRIDIVYPINEGDCNRASYPDCKTLIVMNKSNADFGVPSSSFVSLCRKAFEDGTSYDECMLGRIYASAEGLNNG